MYGKGQGVAEDFIESASWYRRAAEQGNATAQSNLGAMYAVGKGVAQDYKEAVKWYRLAAEQGNAAVQNNLGALYENGQGVAANRIVAYAFYSLSAAGDSSGANRAAGNLARLSGTLSAREIEAAKEVAREMSKPGNLLKALDKYLPKSTRVKKN
jgi:TPR repeat protein